jgi:hypothetical protein
VGEDCPLGEHEQPRLQLPTELVVRAATGSKGQKEPVTDSFVASEPDLPSDGVRRSIIFLVPRRYLWVHPSMLADYVRS